MFRFFQGGGYTHYLQIGLFNKVALLHAALIPRIKHTLKKNRQLAHGFWLYEKLGVKFRLFGKPNNTKKV
jgi:hypothetical protein